MRVILIAVASWIVLALVLLFGYWLAGYLYRWRRARETGWYDRDPRRMQR